MNYTYGTTFSKQIIELKLDILCIERLINISEVKRKISTYDILFDYENYHNLSEKTFLYNLVDTNNRKCAFCLKNSDESKFIKDAHVIPFLLGNNFLLHYDECDDCNEHFGRTIECEFDKYLTPYRTLNRTRNRTGNLINTDLGNKRSFRFDESKNAYVGELFEENISFDENSNIATFDLTINKYIPALVFKALMKICYGVLPREHRYRFEKLREWIITKDNNLTFFSPLTVIKTQINGYCSKILDLKIFHKKNSDLSNFEALLPTNEDFEYLVQLRFGNIVLEFPILSDLCLEKMIILMNNNRLAQANFPYIPKYGFPPVTEIIDFSQNEKIKGKESFSIFVESINSEQDWN